MMQKLEARSAHLKPTKIVHVDRGIMCRLLIDAVYSHTYTTPSSPQAGLQSLERVPYFELLQVIFLTVFVNALFCLFTLCDAV